MKTILVGKIETEETVGGVCDVARLFGKSVTEANNFKVVATIKRNRTTIID